MARTVIVRLTVPQAVAMSHALSNTVDHPDAMEAIFPNKSERSACYRADNALVRAINKVGGFSSRLIPNLNGGDK
jgi:hypothetical protein